MSITELFHRLVIATDLSPDDREEVVTDLEEIFEQELVLKLHQNPELTAIIKPNADLSLSEISQQLETNSTFQKIYQETFISTVSGWLNAILPALTEEQQKKIVSTLADISNELTAKLH